MTDKITMDDIDEALRVTTPDERRMAGHFTEAGFTAEEAARGAKMMRSGRYFGFVDVATSLRPAGVPGAAGMTPVMEAAVQKIAREIEPKPTKTPWGRPRAEGAELSEAELREVLESTTSPGLKRVVKDWLRTQEKGGQR